MPQLNPEFFISQLFWLAIFFTFLLFFLWRVSLPRIANVLEKRHKIISENLSTAKELQQQAIEIEKNINVQISKVKEDADEELKKVINSLQEEVSVKLSNLDKDLDLKISNSEKQILKNRDDQMKNIDEEILKITKIMVSKISDLKLTDSVVEEAVKSFKGSIN
tara:strand:+ start:234 stop:725 length:492 start_codon:yes stop_codon:yes gene_type:complete